jgi:hypothetical protein
MKNVWLVLVIVASCCAQQCCSNCACNGVCPDADGAALGCGSVTTATAACGRGLDMINARFLASDANGQNTFQYAVLSVNNPLPKFVADGCPVSLFTQSTRCLNLSVTQEVCSIRFIKFRWVD